MKMIALVVSTASLLWPIVASAQLNVLISGGFSGPYEQLLPDFERSSGIKVKTGSGASQGTGPQTIAAQLTRGVAVDVVILSKEGLEELIAARKIVTGTSVDLARVGLGVAVKTGTAKPDLSTVDAFKQALLGGRKIAIPGSTSGIWLSTVLFPKLGLHIINVQITPRGTDATALVASGGVDLAVLPVSEIVHATGVELAGSIAPEIQFIQAFSAAIVAGSGENASAKRLIEHLTSVHAVNAIRKSGMEPAASPAK